MPRNFSLAALRPGSQSKHEVKETTSQDTGQKTDNDYPDGARLFFTALALAVTILTVSLDGTIVSTAIPQITNQFHSVSDVG
jgi:hypothetical protein